ncbi:nicotinate-nucleotide adenylyltransferase [Thermodesulfobacteriota bacterium]
MIETGVIHGRFQVLHNDHMKYLLAGKEKCRHLVVGITNPDPTLTKDDHTDPGRSNAAANPLTYFERYTMIREALQEKGVGLSEFSIVPFPINFPELYKFYLPMDARFFLTIYDAWGEKKLAQFQNIGLEVEVLWRKPIEDKGLRASEIRGYMLQGKPWQHLVPESTRELIEVWDIPNRLLALDTIP